MVPCLFQYPQHSGNSDRKCSYLSFKDWRLSVLVSPVPSVASGFDLRFLAEVPFLSFSPINTNVANGFRTNPNGRRNLFCAAKFPPSLFYPPFFHPNPSQRRRKKLGESGSSRFSPSVPEVSTLDQLRDGSRHALWDHRLKCIWRFPKMVVPPSHHCLKPD